MFDTRKPVNPAPMCIQDGPVAVNMQLPVFAFWTRVGVFCLAQVVSTLQNKSQGTVRGDVVLLTCTHILLMAAAYVVIQVCAYIMASVRLRGSYLQVHRLTVAFSVGLFIAEVYKNIAHCHCAR